MYATGSQHEVMAACRLFVQFLFSLQGVDLPLCWCIKSCCAVAAFIQVEVVMLLFHHVMPCCCLSPCNKLGSCCHGAGGDFLSIQGFSHSSLCHFVKLCVDASVCVVLRW